MHHHNHHHHPQLENPHRSGTGCCTDACQYRLSTLRCRNICQKSSLIYTFGPSQAWPFGLGGPLWSLVSAIHPFVLVPINGCWSPCPCVWTWTLKMCCFRASGVGGNLLLLCACRTDAITVQGSCWWWYPWMRKLHYTKDSVYSIYSVTSASSKSICRLAVSPQPITLA